MKWYQTKGVVTGGAFGGMLLIKTIINFKMLEGGCKPYPLTMDDPVFPSSTPCEKKCNSNYTTRSYKKDKHKAKKRFGLKTEKAIKKEILARGSVVTTIKAYSDFGGYQSGIYHHTTGGTTNQHTYGRIVGWGVENGVKYWKIGHVWGETWGEQGYFRIIRGINHCEVESRAMAVTVKKD
ncbi:Cysteine protease 1 [Aphelenchoides bicaudatus]|nr:Cysteine protease 1 [Aphelenchoides bicaudatus]